MTPSHRSASAVPAVRVSHLSFAYGTQPVLKDISFTVTQGEIFGLLGPNGSGKTTLFRILSTLLSSFDGEAEIFGKNVSNYPNDVRKIIGAVFQSFALDRKLTVYENLKYQGFLYGLSGQILSERIEHALGRLGVSDRKNDLVEHLSGGLQRRVEIAKALLHNSRLLIMDEPATGLDPGSRLGLWKLLEELRSRDGTTVMLTTHLLDEAEQCDRIALFDLGCLVALGSPGKLKAEIGGDIISISAIEPERLRNRIEAQLRVRATLADGVIHIEKDHAHRFIPRLVEAFPREIQSITVRKPSLEDVFVRYTGHAFLEQRKGGDG